MLDDKSACFIEFGAGKGKGPFPYQKMNLMLT